MKYGTDGLVGLEHLRSQVTDEMVVAFGGPQSSNLWVREGLANVVPLVQRDTLRAVWDAMVSPHAEGLDANATKVACEQIERIARERGIAL